MATIGDIERAINSVERFRVCVVDLDGRDVRTDRPVGNVLYRYRNSMNGNSTVAEWRRVRFQDLRLADVDVVVLDGQGRPVHGNTLLSTVRSTY